MTSPLPVPPEPSAAVTPMVTIVGSTSLATRSASHTEGDEAAGRRDVAVAWRRADDRRANPPNTPTPTRMTAAIAARTTMAHTGKRPRRWLLWPPADAMAPPFVTVHRHRDRHHRCWLDSSVHEAADHPPKLHS